jgi:hypothetical protein
VISLNWRDHSLSLTCIAIGVGFICAAFLFEHGTRGWDTVLGIGHGFLTVGGFGLLSGPLRERNKPEK